MKLELRKVDHLEKTADGAHYSRDIYSIGSYCVHDDSTTLENGRVLRSIDIRVVDTESDNRYLPEIYYRDECLGTRKPEFEIQTTALGPLGLDKFKAFMAALQAAVDVTEILTEKLITNRRT